jgi:hypothetical protein
MHHNGSMITGFAGNDDSPVKMLSYEFAWNSPRRIEPGIPCLLFSVGFGVQKVSCDEDS